MPAAARRLARRYRASLPAAAAPCPQPPGRRTAGPARARGGAAPETGPREALLRALERGRSVDHAIVAQVRALIAGEAHDTARALAESLRRRPETARSATWRAASSRSGEGYAELACDELRARAARRCG